MKLQLPNYSRRILFAADRTGHLRNFLRLSAFFSMTVVSAYADPVVPTPPVNAPPNNPAPTTPVDKAANDKLHELIGRLAKRGHQRDKNEPTKEPRLIKDVTLNYEGATPYSNEVLNTKVTVKLTQASFLATLEAVMQASAKTCRIECRSISPMRISLNVKDATVVSLLDSLAKLGSSRLYVLPSELIIAPESALSDDEKKKVKPYGVLLSATTLPGTAEYKALMVPGTQGKSILDCANTSISADIDDLPISALTSLDRLKAAGHIGLGDMMQYGVQVSGPVSLEDYVSTVSMNLRDVKYGDALASLAHLLGCELYMTPTHFVIIRTNSVSVSGDTPSNFQGELLFPAFAPSSTSFPDTSAGKS